MKYLLATIFALGLAGQAMAIPDSVKGKPKPKKRGITSPHKRFQLGKLRTKLRRNALSLSFRDFVI